ncbi:hypothetical protein [Nocardioides abyssi]|uniref:Uncharacterized protein n=1 Tax=Nocardioides abyssi TaxID=3058370 RepID=A0ABT8ESJ6_9ACTN|nr:hypothetical protein [Nocardioides abyssi]MDN4161105.1 hypothetical protein [Nocardioides abyssi]
MPEDVDAVVTELLERRSPQTATRRPDGGLHRLSRLDEGVYAIDHGDDDHAFLLSVERVPRLRWKPQGPVPIGPVDGIMATCTGVTVDNFVHIRLTAAPSAERDRLTRDHQDAFEQWASTPKGTRGDPPTEPAERLLRVQMSVSDDLGTTYEIRMGQCGGTGTEWDASQSFRPRPPGDATELRVELQVLSGPAVVLSVPLG